jgi:predicted N-acetyltransferase YhbS
MPTNALIKLRPLEVHDLPAAHALSQAVSWSHRLEDWRTLSSVGNGIAAIDANDVLQGVALWWSFGDDFATLGMVIVSPTRQKSGIGRRLLEAIMTAVGQRRVLLYATLDGLRLYESLGFVAKSDICIHQGVIARDAVPVETDALIRPMTVADRSSVRALDRRATGGERDTLLTALETVSQGFVAERDGIIRGYALCRDFGRGKLIGPMVAESEWTAIALASAEAVGAGGFVRIDIPETASALASWLSGAGLSYVGRVKTMWRGSPSGGDHEIKVFSLASQAVG